MTKSAKRQQSFPVNLVGEKLLRQTIEELVQHKFLKPGVYDLVYYYRGHGINQQSNLNDLAQICSYKIIAEIDDADLRYEICRLNQSDETMKINMEAIFPYIDKGKLDITREEYEKLSIELFDYSLAIQQSLKVLIYMNADEIKTERNKAIGELCALLIKQNKYFFTGHWDKLDFTGKSIEVSFHNFINLIKLITKESPDKDKTKFSDDNIEEIEYSVRKILIKNPEIIELRNEMTNLGEQKRLAYKTSWWNTYRATKESLKKMNTYQEIIDNKFSYSEQTLKNILFNAIMQAIHKQYIITSE